MKKSASYLSMENLDINEDTPKDDSEESDNGEEQKTTATSKGLGYGLGANGTNALD